MDRQKFLKYFLIGILLIACVTIWVYVYDFYQDHRSTIDRITADITRQVTLPFMLAELANEPPETELPMPVYGVQLSEVADTWGAARSEGRTHEGTDIFAARGTPVFSTTRGYVTRLNIGNRGGYNVMVTGPGGLRYYYAHFDRVADGIRIGMPVTTDTVLGFVGDTGNASGTPPHLHFGIYPERWNAINPYEFLVDRW